MKQPIQVNFYTRPVCPLCDKAKTKLLELTNEFPLVIHEIDIYQDDELLEKYQLMIPVIEIDGEEVDYGMVSEDAVRHFLQSKYEI
ncbi:glutaredoxin-like protein [Schinkia azotoformans MEV2011]|uniref:Glutaredoxin-like protein n=1 Tax=Schinkia azotoformans MEV2011 TaxID=1348973 RepID=A0A072NTN9_SCHAZ|nr:glutaredoxin family protein [Schinkia azotoformans]KEF40253.1 glutaredoxin-like protein [Schinkia azotoformans MEV2011]MEC1696439.1 glutaredoxin family protein [Schinkia azotoformans]MEC1715174.1 glutaredoxin family protein [Schinkia azotoformans]MEC1724110.1 glutaredoxin family protein [Schinkia azotoformans]MEC1739776.1 glutaredoxin family protein [Schinkia azotoformans]